jgi:hypothetical protein
MVRSGLRDDQRAARLRAGRLRARPGRVNSARDGRSEIDTLIAGG